MGILAVAEVLTLVSLAACYSPELIDCTVSCESLAECADGQICGEQHLCVAKSRSCRDVDVNAVLADMSLAMLQLQIEGKGRIAVAGVAACDADAPDDGACSVLVPMYVALTVSAQSYPDWIFDRWTATCTTMDTTCELVPDGATLVGVKFRRKEH